MDVLEQAVNSAAGRAVYSSNPDLTAFREAGGKLIQYHGWNDPVIPAGSSFRYYESVAIKMGGVEKIKTFYRLFMAPGMEHCGGGPGPNTVTGVFGESSPSHDPDHDVVAAVAHWVERDRSTQITATLYRGDGRGKEIVAQRPWCATRNRPLFWAGCSQSRFQLQLRRAPGVVERLRALMLLAFPFGAHPRAAIGISYLKARRRFESSAEGKRSNPKTSVPQGIGCAFTPLGGRSVHQRISSTGKPKLYAALIATTLDSRRAFTSRSGGCPKKRLYSRLN